MSRILEFRVLPEQDGKRLDVVLPHFHPELSRSQAKIRIQEGLVRVDGKPITKAGHFVFANQQISFELLAPKKMALEGAPVGIRILHEDEDLAVILKPSGLSVHPSSTESGLTVVHGLLHSLKSLSSVGGIERPGIVHRLDKGTSGVLVVSKNDRAHLHLSAQFKAHTIDRRYLALVYGLLSKKTGKVGKKGFERIETFYGRNPSNRKKFTGKLASGRQAITNWKLLEEFSGISFIECKLETGRTHQIRVHLAELGYPVLGDPLYCENAKRARTLTPYSKELAQACLGLKHQLLHAVRLGFTHPRSGERLEIETELPEDFRFILNLARAPK